MNIDTSNMSPKSRALLAQLEKTEDWPQVLELITLVATLTLESVATGPWIPVTERLPERDPDSNYGYSAEVLVELADGGHRLDAYNHDKGRWTDWRGVVAWAEIRRGRS